MSTLYDLKMTRRLALSLPLLLVLLSLCNVAAADAAVNYRLGSDIVPWSYDILLKPYLLAEDGAKQFTFDGDVNITLSTKLANTQQITLHKNLIDIKSATLFNGSGHLVELQDMSYDSVTQKLTLLWHSQLTVGLNYTLYIRYSGLIRDGLAGLFRANYTDAAGNEKWIAVTQSQRIDARSIFPCFDEPAMKATFRLHLSRPKQYNTVFNTRLESSQADGVDRYVDHFAWTPLMSTYLFAFIMSEFESRGSTDLKVITRAEYSGKTDFAYAVAERALNAYDFYTQLPYKELGNDLLQNAGSPKFPHNGMENWGLIIYSDGVLVQEPGYTDGWSNKEYTLTILVHEIAHMWFGDSVTFAWWSYFWLNEAFARYYQYFMAHELYPEYQLDQQFVVNQLQMIFATDAINSSQPMTSVESEIQTPAQIGYKFSSIAYAKGASILRMIANIMGHENFDNAIRAYLKEYQFSSTIPENFFKHLKAYWPTAPQVDLDQFFHDWTEQVGFPTLSVTVTDERTVTLSQKRFLLKPSDGSDPRLLYTIPITYATDAEQRFDNLTPHLYLSNSVTELTTEKPFKWIIFNLQQSNYYRVFYDTQTLWNIQTALEQPQHSSIPASNRAQLVDDLFNFARIDMQKYDLVFQFLEYLATEVDYLPWYAMFKNLPRVAERLTQQQQTAFGKYLGDITLRVFTQLGFPRDNDTVLEVYTRNRVIDWTCKYHLHECGKEARAHFDVVHQTGVKPLPDFRETLYCGACRDGIFAYYDTLHRWFEAETLVSEKEKLMRAMACTRHFTENHYALILNGLIPAQYAVTGITPMYTQNPENVTPVFRMISDTIERLAVQLGSWSTAANVISDIANYFTTNEQKELLEKLIAEKGELFGSDISKLNTAVRTVNTNLEWAEVRLATLMKYLEQRNAASLSSLSTALMILIGALYALLQ